MWGIEISTSKPGVLWPGEHWKCLIDALARGGARRDPGLKYPDLRPRLDSLCEERNRRFFPKSGTALEALDDVSVRSIRVRRCRPGAEEVALCQVKMPATDKWHSVQVPFFGTIGGHRGRSRPSRTDR